MQHHRYKIRIQTEQHKCACFLCFFPMISKLRWYFHWYFDICICIIIHYQLVAHINNNNKFLNMYYHCVQTDPAKNVWTRAYLIPERNLTVRKQEEGNNSVYLFVFCMNLGEINALLTISCCQMKHFGYVIVY